MEKPTFSTAETLQYTEADVGRICSRAYELYEQRGRVHGYDFDDWVKAESEVLATQLKTATR
ncbi:MAG TPA: DUF2934 domain-containing protein [Terriglobales bacterium]|nr:DUF2934 domain-containing protein [Terriglobales bacterium]